MQIPISMSFSKSLPVTLYACALLASGTALAATYPVSCTGASPTGIQAAVMAIAGSLPNGPNTITVSGTCEERVVIHGLRHLLIQAGSSGSGIKSPDTNAAAVVNISESFDIKLWDLVLDGNGKAGLVGVGSSQQVQALRLTYQNGDAGLTCSYSSYCMIGTYSDTTTLFSGLTGPAISVGGDSVVDIGGAGTTVTINDTGGGISVGGGSQVYVMGNWTIQTTGVNGSYGIALNNAQFASRSCGTGNAIRNADVGVLVSENSSFTYSCPLTIENNKQGVLVEFSSVAHIGTSPGNVIIRNNSDSQFPQRYGGLVVNDNSVATVIGAQISGNQLAGVYSRNNGMITLYGCTITGNLGDGVLVTQRSAVWLNKVPAVNTISGNTGNELVCTVQGTAFGDSSGVSGKLKQCKSFEEIP